MSDLVTFLAGALAHGGLVALPAAALGGVLSGLNPCCLPLYPAAVASCCASREDARSPAGPAAAFVLGTAISTAILGVLAAVAGRTIANLGGWVAYVIAALPLVMGLHLLGWIRLPMPKAATGSARRRGPLGAFVSGLLLSFVVAPCGTPILASVLSFAALRGNVAYGGLLLFGYGLGAGLPVLVLGTATTGLAARLDRLGRRGLVDQVAGVALLGVGLYVLWRA